VRKQSSDSRESLPSDILDSLLHAIALVMLRRQMKGRWTTINRTLKAVV
jgi:hypothetical protein